TCRYAAPRPSGLNVGMIVNECPPGPRMKTPLLISGFARHGTGSSPQSTNAPGSDVTPIEAPKSNISNAAPLKNASTTVSVLGPVNVQGGASRKVVGVPEL